MWAAVRLGILPPSPQGTPPQVALSSQVAGGLCPDPASVSLAASRASVGGPPAARCLTLLTPTTSTSANDTGTCFCLMLLYKCSPNVPKSSGLLDSSMSLLSKKIGPPPPQETGGSHGPCPSKPPLQWPPGCKVTDTSPLNFTGALGSRVWSWALHSSLMTPLPRGALSLWPPTPMTPNPASSQTGPPAARRLLGLSSCFLPPHFLQVRSS